VQFLEPSESERRKKAGIPGGIDRAFSGRMATARRFEDLEAWQLSVELRDRILHISPAFRGDQAFLGQIKDAACSAPRNLAEGFGLFKPRAFARHARIARGSLVETQNHLRDALSREWLTPDEARALLQLNDRAIGATTRLLKYLDSCAGEAPTGWER
jgi:four helix bundle protein